MANKQHVTWLQRGWELWNRWRWENPDIEVDLSGANLNNTDLSYMYLRDVNLSRANLTDADLSKVDAVEANFSHADLSHANLRRTNLIGVDLTAANMRGADLWASDLSRANLSLATIGHADFTKVTLNVTKFLRNDLSQAKGLATVRHQGPSIIDIDTLYRSRGRIPVSFLRACNISEHLIEALPLLANRMEPSKYCSCFISYSSNDNGFAERLYESMHYEQIPVWFAPEHLKAGEMLYEQIDQAISLYDRVLLILSSASINSKWVETELRRAHKTELKEKRRKLLPIRLVSFQDLRPWVCFDADTGEDLAVEVRKYYIPDFSNWQNQEAFQAAFSKLLRKLKVADTTITAQEQ